MRSMGRPRTKNKDLPPGLYVYPARDAYVKLGKGKPVRLEGVRTREEALALYWELKRIWDAEQSPKRTERIVASLTIAAKGGDTITIAAYAKSWRETRLPTMLKRDGNPLADKTRRDYERMLKLQVEKHERFTELAIIGATTKDIRGFLAQWIGSPNYYNNMKSLLSRLFDDAVDEAKLDANPVADVRRRAVAKRKVYCPMDHYMSITKHMIEWEARVCDLIYLASHRPGDVLRLKDAPPDVRYESRNGRQVVVLGLKPTKNDEAIDIWDYTNKRGGIEETLGWLRQWKKAQAVHGAVKNIVVYPKTSRRRSIGQPVSVTYIWRKFAAAIVKAGFAPGAYTVRDLRKKGLTDEAHIAGKATNKGAHKTQAMREYYVVNGIPQRAQNNLTVLRATK
jgi:hypothetical protein